MMTTVIAKYFEKGRAWPLLFSFFFLFPLTGNSQTTLNYKYSNGVVSYDYLWTHEDGRVRLRQNVVKANGRKEEIIIDFNSGAVTVWQDEDEDCIVIDCKSSDCLESQRVAADDVIHKTSDLHIIYVGKTRSETARITTEITNLLDGRSKKTEPVFEDEEEADFFPDLEETVTRPDKSINTIDLVESASGVFLVDVTINGSQVDTYILDSGASLICINWEVWSAMKAKGLASDADVIGKTNSTIADGSVVTNYLVQLEEVAVGDYVFKDVQCVLSPNSHAPLLLGQNVLSRLGKFVIDYGNSKIVIEE